MFSSQNIPPSETEAASSFILAASKIEENYTFCNQTFGNDQDVIEHLFFLRNQVYISLKSLMVYNLMLTKAPLKENKNTFEPLQASSGSSRRRRPVPSH